MTCILIRADAGVEIGTGHVMRCLALAQAWQDAGGEAVFAMAESTPAIATRLAAEGFRATVVQAAAGSDEDANWTVELARAHAAEWIVLDGYRFDAAYQQVIKGSGRKLLCIDDMGECDHYFADVVLNQNLNAAQTMYQKRQPATQLLLGTQYALLRREFVKWRLWNRELPEVGEQVLVTIGGSDPSGLTRRLLEAPEFSEMASAFVLGGSAREPPELANRSAGGLVRDQGDMAQIMAGSDITVICGGGTLWESLFMGCSTLSYTRNRIQQEIMERLDEIGAAIDLGNIEAFDVHALIKEIRELKSSVPRRRAMSELGRELVDGRGGERVVGLLRYAR